MNKNQLKTGMVLELRNGKQFLLLKDTPTIRDDQIMIQGTDIAVSLNGNEQINLMDYNFRLYKYSDTREMDIVRVSIPHYPAQLFGDDNIVLKTMWEREQKG